MLDSRLPGIPLELWLQAKCKHSARWLFAVVANVRQTSLCKRYYQNSMEIDSPEFKRIQQACADNKIHVMFGFVEKIQGTLYMAQTLLDSTGAVLLHRHKTKPTHVERTLFGEGSGM